MSCGAEVVASWRSHCGVVVPIPTYPDELMVNRSVVPTPFEFDILKLFDALRSRPVLQFVVALEKVIKELPVKAVSAIDALFPAFEFILRFLVGV